MLYNYGKFKKYKKWRIMKNIFKVSAFIIILILPTVIFAQQAPLFSIENPISFGSVQEVIRALIQVAFMAAGLVAVIFLIIGGYRYITSSGNPEAIEGAKGTIINAIVGLIIIFIASLLVSYILSSLHIRPLYQLGIEPAETNTESNNTQNNENQGLPVVE